MEQTYEKGPWKVFALIGYILGIIVFVCGCLTTVLALIASKIAILSYIIGLFSFCIGVESIVLSALGKKSQINLDKANKGLIFSIAGSVLSIVFAIYGLVVFIGSVQ